MLPESAEVTLPLPKPAAAGFTLIELLTVVGIMAVLGSIAFGFYYDSAENTKEELARVQMAELAKAVRQFRLDTGYYPRQGPFALDVDPAGAANGYGGISGSGWSADQRAFFYSPANLDQLIVQPVLNSTANMAQSFLATWDANSRRGWRGPYLQLGASGVRFADVGANLAWDGSGDPTQGTALIDMPVLGDVRERAPVEPGGWTRCTSAPSNSACLLDMRTAAGLTDSLLAAARPLLLIVDPNPAVAAAPRIVGFGHDGIYGNADDLVVNLEQ